MKKNLFFILLFGASSSFFAQQNVSISDVPAIPNPTSVLDVSSTTKGMLMPRMTTAQRNGIVGPANGLLVYDTDVNCVMYYSTTLTSWNSLCAGSSASSLIANTTTVAAGANCPSGGVLLQLGNDGNSNGSLDVTEITSSQYICNGQAGAAGPQGPVGAAGPQGLAGTNGINCWDLNGNGTNDPTEDVNGDGLFNSTDCSVGIVGPQGPVGAIGPQGPIGLTGPAGPSGTVVNKYSAKLSSLQSTNSNTYVDLTGMSITFTPVNSTVYLFASATARLTNNSGAAQEGQALFYIRAVNASNTELARAGNKITDYDDVNGIITGGTVSFNGVPVTVTPGVSTTIRIQWRGTYLWAASPYQIRIDPTAINIGDHCSFFILD